MPGLVGDRVGFTVGATVGAIVGCLVGTSVGDVEGGTVGAGEEFDVGDKVQRWSATSSVRQFPQDLSGSVSVRVKAMQSVRTSAMKSVWTSVIELGTSWVLGLATLMVDSWGIGSGTLWVLGWDSSSALSSVSWLVHWWGSWLALLLAWELVAYSEMKSDYARECALVLPMSVPLSVQTCRPVQLATCSALWWGSWWAHASATL